MKKTQLLSFWYQFHTYMHDSWFSYLNIPEMTESSSYLRRNLAYQEMCFRLGLDKGIDSLNNTDSLDFILNFVSQPDRYLKIAGMTISLRPKADFFDAALMSAAEIAFAKQTCKAMSMNQRFVCDNQFQSGCYDSGAMLLHAYVQAAAPDLWQRIKLAIAPDVVNELDFLDEMSETHKLVLKRLWKSVDYFINSQSQETKIAA